MTKKIFAMFLAVLMVVSMLPTSVFAADGCPGQGSNNHTVKNCDWTLIKVTEPGCGTDGYTSYKCNFCGDLFIDSQVPATGEHVWVPAEDVAPTCGTWGRTGGMECACGAVKDATPVPPTHKEGTACEFGEWTPASVDCLTGGVQTRTCKACGHTEERKIEKVDAHTWGQIDLVTPATPEAEGLAVVTCEVCGKQKEVNVYFEHEHDKLYIPQVDATCTTPGVKAHYECRVCGAWFTKSYYTTPNTDAQNAALVIPASHTWKDGIAPTCANPTAYCVACQTSITLPVADLHNIDWDVTSEATCDAPGLKVGTCLNPGCMTPTFYQVIPAKGHITQSFYKPATCGTYAFTYTVCLRENCSTVKKNNAENIWVDSDGRWYDLSLEGATLKVGVPFSFKVYQGTLGKTLYFTGKMNGYYFATSESAEDAVDMFVEAVEGVENAYQLYFMNGDVKTYITVELSGYYKNVKMVTEAPTNYWKWNKDLSVMTITLNGTEYYLGVYTTSSGKPYTTISASEIKYLEQAMESQNPTSWACQYPLLDNSTLHVVNVAVRYESGFDANSHRVITVTTPPTCQTTGYVWEYCSNHECPVNYTNTTILDKVDHKWADANADDVQNAGIVLPTSGLKVAPTCTTAGYAYEKCEYCGIVSKNIKAATGHSYDDREEPFYQEGSHTSNSYYYWICEAGCEVRTGETTWEGLNKTWDVAACEDGTCGNCATCAHGTLIYAGVFTPGTCTSVGLEKWFCSDPECDAKAIYTKQYTTILDANGDPRVDANGDVMYFITGSHVDIDMKCEDPDCTDDNCTGYKSATCTADGYKVTYQCARCNAIVGNVKLHNHNTISAKGHVYVDNPNYKKPDCDAPIFPDDTKWECLQYCVVCGDEKGDGTTKLVEFTLKDIVDRCETYTFTYYLCHCGEEHAYNYAGKFNHVFREVAGTRVEPTCYAAGSVDMKCADCGLYVAGVEIAKVPHTNKDDVKFTDKCTDTTEDRHCVVCHAHYEHDELGNAHDCYTADADENKVLDCLGYCLIGKQCHYAISKLVPSTCTTNAHYLEVCGDCGAETVLFVNMGWNGHRPPEADVDANGNTIYYANYDYVEYTWVSIEVVNGQFEKNVETYLAKFIEYVEPTYTSNGYFKAYCTECKMEVTQEIPKLSGLGMQMTITNANGASEFAVGSLVEVVVNANGANLAVQGFEYDVDYTGLVYVGYEIINNDFVLTVTEPMEAALNGLIITGRAANDASGKMQNIVITEETPLVKLLFRAVEVGHVTNPANGRDSFGIALGYGRNHAYAKDDTTPIVLNREIEYATIRNMFDFNSDNVFHITDLLQAESLLTFEHPDGKTYDVTLDVNKDGEITPEDLTVAYNCYVGNLTVTECFLMGIEAEEAEFLLELKDLLTGNYCVHCGTEVSASWEYCPSCGKNPNP